jgi:hypothetical protein
VLHLYGDRVLPFDSPTAEIAGALSDLARGRGHSPGFADIVIAATAHWHDLTILSRNERHFAPMDVAVVDPFGKLPPANQDRQRCRPVNRAMVSPYRVSTGPARPIRATQSANFSQGSRIAIMPRTSLATPPVSA